MTTACVRQPLLALCLATLVPWDGSAAPAENASVTAGLNITLEASANSHGGANCGQAAQALTIGHISWQHQAAEAGGVELQAFASALNHAGRGPTERFLGDFLAASNIEAYSSTRLYSWWLEATRRDTSLRAGALLADEEFAGTATGGQFINSAFGWPAFISANTINTGPAFYVAAIGARLARAFTPALTGRIGIYDGDSVDSPTGDPHVTRHGTHYDLGGTQGWFLISELAWAPENGATRWKTGFWHHTARFADQYYDKSGNSYAVTGGDPRDHDGNSGVYAVIEQTFAGTPGKAGHIDGFVRIGGAPADRNVLAWAADAGIAIVGALPFRPDDTLALGFAHGAFSHRFVATAQLLDPTAEPLDAEQVLEVGYTFGIGAHLTCKPDLQYIRHPGGSCELSDTTLFTLRLIAEF